MKVLLLLALGAIAALSFADSPFACNRTALTPQARKRHFDELTPALRARQKSIRELRDGFEFEFSSDPATLQLVSEWIQGDACAAHSSTSTCASSARAAACGCALLAARA